MLYPAFVPYQSLFFDYIETTQPHNMHVLQYHDCYEIYLQTQGERFFFINGNCYTCTPGCIFIAKPYDMHYARSLTSKFYARYVINFHADQLELLLTPAEKKLLFDKFETCIMA